MNFIFFYLVFVAKGLFYIYSLDALSVYSDMIGQNSNCIKDKLSNREQTTETWF